ncbi:MAG TPA: hypothetical protein VMJ93_10845 [Verrucomicrobiae bacterium]|nr:hypothetical protein [Verrucomicrobiae bacterium]
MNAQDDIDFLLGTNSEGDLGTNSPDFSKSLSSGRHKSSEASEQATKKSDGAPRHKSGRPRGSGMKEFDWRKYERLGAGLSRVNAAKVMGVSPGTLKRRLAEREATEHF